MRRGRTTLYGIEADGALLDLPPAPSRLIEFIGDSHTCGYGTEGKTVSEPFTPETENCDLAWGCIVARCFDADYVLTAHSGQGIVRNWADEKETSDLTMRQRILRTFDMTDSPRWDFRGYKPDIVVIKLGTNDCSTGITPSDQDGDLGAGYHPNHRGHRKFAAAVIPYISTIMGWEMPMEVIQ